MENVKGLVDLNGRGYMKSILKALQGIILDNGKPAYEIHSKVLRTMDHGIPQNRPRWYCVGIRGDAFGYTDAKSGFTWPQPSSCPSIEELLDKKPKVVNDYLNANAKRNIDQANRKIKLSGKEPTDHPYVVDIDASLARSRHIHGFHHVLQEAETKVIGLLTTEDG